MRPVCRYRGAGTIRILALGDSLTAGYGPREADGFTAQLQTALRGQGFAVDIVNAGVSGDTTTGGLARLDWALSDNPDAVILELGANDGLRGIDSSITRANLGAMLAKLNNAICPCCSRGCMHRPTWGPNTSLGSTVSIRSLPPNMRWLYTLFSRGRGGRCRFESGRRHSPDY